MSHWGIGADNTVFTMISGVAQWLATTVYTADNGITLTADNFQLGGPLVEAITNINMSNNALRIYSGDLKLGVIGAPLLDSLEVATSNGDMYFGDLLIYGIGASAAQITLKAGGGSSQWALDCGNVNGGVGVIGDILFNQGSGVLAWVAGGGGDMLIATYDPAGISEQLVGLTAVQSLTNKDVNGVTLTAAGAATNFLNEAGAYISLTAQPANAVLIDAKVNEVAGIAAGEVVYVSGATGGFPQVSLADDTDFTKGDVLAVAIESQADGVNILVCISGLVENINTSGFLAGDILYLGPTGTLVNVQPGGIDVVHRIGYAVKINPATGSMIIDLDGLSSIVDYDGIARHQLVNLSGGTSASAAYTLLNDISHRSSLSMVGSGFTAVPGIAESLVLYNEGYNKTVNAVDGNFGFEWWTDVTDAHSFAATSKMSLSAIGDLSVAGNITAFQIVTSAIGNQVIAAPTKPFLTVNKTAITGGGDTDTLPNTAGLAVGQTFILKDQSFTAATNNWTVDTFGGAHTIDGAANLLFTKDGQSYTIQWDGSTYNII